MTEQSRFSVESVLRTLLIALILAASPARAAVDFVISGTDAPDPVGSLSNLTYTLTITNTGTTTATGVSITNVLSSRVNFVSVTTTRGSCTNVAGIVRCDWTTVNAGAGGRVTIVARPIGPGMITNTVSVSATQVDANPANNVLSQTTLVVNRRVFQSTDFIQLEDVLANVASVYPSTINVSGLTAAVHKVTVTLNNLSHTGPDDLDILLVGPQGRYVMLLSDGQTEPEVVDVTVTFDDAATRAVPDTNGLVTGTFRPANYGNLGPDLLPTPAPEGPHFTGFTNLAIFNGLNPNGDWRLFVYDDEPEAGGWIDGWSLTISTLEPMADLGASVADTPDPALPGDTITYTSTITNAGPAGATGAWMTNQFSAGLELISYSTSRGACTNSGGTIGCDFGIMAPQTSERLVVQVRAISGGSYTNRATVGAAQLDAHLADNAATQSTVVEPRVDLVVDVTSSRTPALLEQPLVYTLAVTNFGPDTATSVRVVDTLPPGVLLVNASATQGSCTNDAGVVTCNLGALASQARVSMLLTCRPTLLGSITNLVTVSSDRVDSNPANNSAQNLNTVDPAADLLLTMVDSPDPVVIGQPLTFSILVTNRGPSTATNILVSDTLPASLSLVSVQATQGACTNTGNAITCAVDQLPPGATLGVTLVAIPGALGNVINTAAVTAQPVDPNQLNNTAGTITAVAPAADIAVSKAGERELLWQGDRVVYNLVVSNGGPNTATGVRVNDVLPAGVSLISAVATAGSCSSQGATVTCALGELASGNVVTVTIIGTAGQAGSITNVASALANEHDLNLANNAAMAVTIILPKTTFSDATPVLLPEAGPSPVYPLTINVSGLTAAVHQVRVRLPKLSHSYPDDLDLLLVAPGGQALVIMSDVGGSASITNLELILEDIAPATLPDGGTLTAGAYRPADYEAFPSEFPAPAPAGLYGANFGVFTRTDPNGTWQLYVVDDFAKDAGFLGEGWSLDISTRDPIADLGLSAQASTELVAVGSNLVFGITISNRGPGVASTVVLSNAYPSSLVFVDSTSSQGNCTNESGVVRCDLGELGNGGTASVQLVFTVGASGIESNQFDVSSAAPDFNLADNSASVGYTAEQLPVIVTQPQDQNVTAGGTAILSVTASGSPPLSYQWFHNGAPVPDAAAPTLVLSDVQLEVVGDYHAQVSNRVGSVLSGTARVGFPRPPALDVIPDQLMGEDEVLTVPLVIMDPDNPTEVFGFSAVCENTNLVAATNFSFTVSGTNYALVIQPATNGFGTNLVTVTVTDSGGLSATRAFFLGVRSINDYPVFVAPIGDQVIDEDEILELPVTIGDVESHPVFIAVGHTSYNLALVPFANITWSGFSTNRTVTIRPLPNQSGTALIELRLRDEAQVRSTNLFNLTVRSVNDAPTISAVDDVTLPEDLELNITFIVGDVETAADQLNLRAESSDTNVFPNEALIFSGSGVTRSLRAQPAPDQFGTSRITVFVEDEGGTVTTNSFWVTVDPVNDPPVVSPIPEIITSMDEASAPVVFTIGDLESDADALTLTALSTNTALVPVEGIEFGGSGSNRTVRVTPGAGQFGWTVLRVQVADPEGAFTTRDFELHVHQTNGAPIIALQPQSQAVNLGSPFTLRVIATGPGPLLYQWQRDEQDLGGQTNASIVVASAARPDRGEYRVTISNGEGSVTSLPAQLNVLEATRILSLARLGSSVELTFDTAPKQRYFVEFQDLLGGAWTELPPVDGTGGIVTAIDPGATVGSRFYRVRVE